MTRLAIPLHIDDLSHFARRLQQQLIQLPSTPESPKTGHLSLLNCLARAAGQPNFQALRALALQTDLPRPPASLVTASPTKPELTALARKTLTQFDAQGRLVRLPNRLAVQKMAVWCLWTRFAYRRVYSERDVNDVLKAYNTFGDHVTLRRELVETGLLTRTDDCRVYQKCQRRMTPEISAMLAEHHRLTSAGQSQAL
jgi:hypothetical protein